MNQDPTATTDGCRHRGGYGGVNVAKALDADVEVVLVKPKDAFIHSIGALRVLGDPAFLPKIFSPYDHLLTHGRIVRDRAVEVSAHRIVLVAGKAIPADYVVLATGSTYPSPPRATSATPKTPETTIGLRTTS
jgi:NADH dehydrogenase FAD-containing subunit